MLKTSKYTHFLKTTLYLCTIYTYFRFIVIVLPMKSRSWCTSGNTQRILASVWIVSLLLSSPAFYVVVKFFVTDLFGFRALVQINYIWCCDQIDFTWSLIITFSLWWTEKEFSLMKGHQLCFEHILLISSKGLGTSSNNLLVPLLEVIQYVMRNK